MQVIDKKIPGTLPVRVSIIIPVFNDQSGIDRCLQAISAQTWPINALEVIIVDNGSSPPLSIKEGYSFDARLILCATLGSYAARNAGVQDAKGSVLAFIDADCRPDTNWIAEGVTTLQRFDLQSVIGGEVLLDKPARPSSVALYQCITGFEQETNIREKHFSATANLFCTRTQFEIVGPFDERLMSGGDREWCWRAAREGFGLHYAPTAIVHTDPRTSLHGAVRQARRVVAGRALLGKHDLTHIGEAGLTKRRSTLRAVGWVLSRPQLSLWDRIRVLGAATVIRAASVWERLRLAAGACAERR